MTIQD